MGQIAELIERSQALQAAGQYEEAIEPGREAVRLCEEAAGETPNEYWRHPYLVYALWNLGYAYLRAGHRTEAVDIMARRVAVYRRLADDDPGLGRALIDLSQFLQSAGRYPEAVPPGEEAAAICTALAGATPNQYWPYPYLAQALWNLGYAYLRAGRQDEAVAPMARRVEVIRRLQTRPELGVALVDLSQFLQSTGRYEEAIPPADEAAEICASLAGDTPNQYWPYPYLVHSLWNMGWAYRRAGHHDKAVAPMARRVEVLRRLADQVELGKALVDLSGFLQTDNRFDEAVPPAEEAVAIDEQHAPENLPAALHNLGYAYQHTSRHQEALGAIGLRVRMLEDRGSEEDHSDWEKARREKPGFWNRAGMLPGPPPGSSVDTPRPTVTGPAAAMARNSNQMDVFAIGPDGGVHSVWWNGDPWRDWFRIGDAVFGPDTPIATLSRNDDQMDIFAVGLDGGVWSAWWNGNPWRDWFRIEGRTVFPQNTQIAAVSRNDDQMDLFAVGDDGFVYNAWWNGNPWREWKPIGTLRFPHNTPIAVNSRNDDQMDLFAVWEDGRVWNAWWDGQWHDWTPIGTTENMFAPKTPIAVLSRNDDQMDIFAVDKNGGMWSSWWNGNPWREWFHIAGAEFEQLTPVAALSRNADQMDIFAVGKDGSIWSSWWNGNPWREWFRPGNGEFEQGTVIAALARDADHMDLFAVGRDGRMCHSMWNGNPWLGWFPISIVRPRPFYVIAHNPDKIHEAREALAAGANALGPDINVFISGTVVDGSRLCVAHDMGFPSSPTLAQYLDALHQMALEFPHFALVLFDIKEEAVSPEFGLEILTEIRRRLTYDTDVNVVLSVAKVDHAGAFDRIQEMLGPREGLMVDEQNDPGKVLTMFNNRGVLNQGYGNGISFLNRLIGPLKRYTVEAACAFKAQRGVPKMVVTWTVNSKFPMIDYIQIGVDGIITDDIDELLSVMGESDMAALVRLATRADNPMQPANHAYGLSMYTTDIWRAGTDANVTFQLIGTLGMASKTVDTRPINRMESGDWSHVMIPSDNLGRLQSIVVRHDEQGNAPGWHLDSIRVASHRYRAGGTATFKRWIDGTDPVSAPL